MWLIDILYRETGYNQLFFKNKIKFLLLQALGAGYHENNLMEAPEEEEDIDLMNDETFGGDIDGVYIIHCT